MHFFTCLSFYYEKRVVIILFCLLFYDIFRFKNLDKLIKSVNEDGRLLAFYSTPAAYVERKREAQILWPEKLDDFFPYSDFKQAFWTGYFTSRPTSKGYIRKLTSFLQAARQLETFLGTTGGE